MRNLPASVVKDFTCAELVNMRNKDGVWRPVGDKKVEVENSPTNTSGSYPAKIKINAMCINCGKCVSDGVCPVNAIVAGDPRYTIDSDECIRCGECYEWGNTLGNCPGMAFERIVDTNPPVTGYNVKYFLHTTGTTQQMVVCSNGDIKYFDYPNGTEATLILRVPGRKVRFNAVGNILVIFVEAEEGRAPYMKYAMWGKVEDENTYKYALLPDLKEITLDCVDDCTMVKRQGDQTYNGEFDTEYTVPEDMKGLFLIRAAYETITGEYICPSRVLFCDSSLRVKNTVSGDGVSHVTGKMYFLHEFCVSVGALTINDLIPAQWKDLIVNISVFISAPKVLSYNESHTSYLREKYLNMYKILEIDEYGVYGVKTKGNYIYIKFDGKDVLETNRRLDIIDSCSYYGNTDFVYNSRLFLGDISIFFPAAYNYGYKQNVIDDYRYEYFLKITLKTDYGLLEVLSGKAPVSNKYLDINHNIELGNPTGTTTSEQMANCIVLDSITYTDYRAIKYSIYVREKSDAPVNGCMAWLVSTGSLIPSPDHNMSVTFFRPTRADALGSSKTSFQPYGEGRSNDMFNIKAFGQVFNVDKVISERTQEKVIISNETNSNPSKIKVSSLMFPMIYLNSQSYDVGDKKVVGFSANNLSIDASNFGLYPVFAFTEGGIYAMELGRDGETLVQRIVPLSGDVCINRDSITNIGGATLFASRDGLRVLVGQRSEKITTPLELYGGNPLREATLKNGKGVLDAILNKHGLQGYVDSVDFQTFLAGAKCYYHYKENEVVITNEGYPYSYVYSLNTRMFHKIFERYYHVFNDYPNAYGTNADGSIIYNLGEEIVPLDGRRNVFVQTNAFKLTTDGFEMLRRIFTRFGWSAAPAGSRITIYLFVSNDTRKWAWVDACEITQAKAPNGAQNFAPLRCPASVKYGMLVVAGDMDVVSDCLTHISVEWEQRYGNKLR